MKLFKKACIASIALSASLLATSALAVDINFAPFMKGRQYFECTVSDSNARVQLDTHSVDAQGFCGGHPGHLNVSGQDVNKNYFVVRNAKAKPSMSVSITSGTITCTNLSGPSSRNEYAAGQPFCAMPPACLEKK